MNLEQILWNLEHTLGVFLRLKQAKHTNSKNVANFDLKCHLVQNQQEYPQAQRK